MNLLDDSVFVELGDDVETLDGLAEGDKDLLESLERMAAEMDRKTDNSN